MRFHRRDPWTLSIGTGVLLAVAICLAASASVLAQEAGITITLANGGEYEQQAKEQLERLLETHDVEAWIFTRDVRIESMVVPHSHPVLTVNTRYLDDDDHAISTFLHEQFHWYMNTIRGNARAATEEFRKTFPDAPEGRATGGARDKESTYLHLMVCDLEYAAITELIGEERARALLEGNNHYVWIYDQVLNNPVVREINERNKVLVPQR